MRYEFAVGIKTGDLCWINGPYLCGQKNDLSIFRGGLKTCLEDGERVEADDGYRADDPISCRTRTGISSMYSDEEQKGVRNTVRARQETAHKRMKQFGSLSGIFRHDLDLHSNFVYAVTTFTKINFEIVEPLFYVEYNTTTNTLLEAVQNRG